jgi:sugar/nucleoside kinase (ribokinase family)
LEKLPGAVHEFDVILISDQAETNAGGVITPAVRDRLSDLARGYPNKIFWADSRVRTELFREVILKPNWQEAESACHRALGRVDFQELRDHCTTGLMIVTDGSRGALVIEPGRETWAETKPVESPVDICGAGDSFSAGAAMALAVTRAPVEAARFGNLVASVTIMKKGTGTASPAEVLAGCRG